jgi:Flp pilus assembly protein TadB
MPFKKTISSLLYNAGLEYDTGKFLSTIIMLGIGFGIAVFLTMYNASIELAVSIGAAALVLFEAIVFITLMLSASRRTYLMENSLPDFLILMSSNIRAGFTPDRALFASMRKEFGPLTKEINKAAKAAMTGKAFHEAFQVIGAKIESNILKRSILDC